jgi:hypothetical protein
MTFTKLVRFEHENATHYGDLVKVDGSSFRVRKLSGSVREGFKAGSTDEIVVQKVCINHHSLRVLGSTTYTHIASMSIGKHTHHLLHRVKLYKACRGGVSMFPTSHEILVKKMRISLSLTMCTQDCG